MSGNSNDNPEPIKSAEGLVIVGQSRSCKTTPVSRFTATGLPEIIVFDKGPGWGLHALGSSLARYDREADQACATTPKEEAR